jgi:hypothetical protein
MSIITKLKVSAAITIALALAVAFTVMVASTNIKEAARNDIFSDHVIKDVSDLNSLSYAYLLFKDKRPKAQWQIKHTSLGKTLSEHTTTYEAAKHLGVSHSQATRYVRDGILDAIRLGNQWLMALIGGRGVWLTLPQFEKSDPD